MVKITRLLAARVLPACILAGGLVVSAAEIKVEVSGTTSTQAVLRYTAPDDNACVVRVSQASSFAPLVTDLDPVLFPGTDSDFRSGNVVSGRQRTILLGSRTIALASDGRRYSRALQADSDHFVQVSCGADSGTASFHTANPGLGSAPEVPLFDAAQFGNYAQPTIDFTDQNKTYIDPLTGILLKRITSPGDVGDTGLNNIYTTLVDHSGVWNSLSNLIATSGFASYGGSGTSADYVFLVAPINLGGTKGFGAKNVLLDFRVQFVGWGSASNAADNTLSGCLSTDHGETCATAIVDIPAFPTGSGAAASRAFPSTWPTPVFSTWTVSGAQPLITPNLQTRTGSVAVDSGTQVTLLTGDTFQDWGPGSWIMIAGSGCPNGDKCVIANITDAKHLVLQTPSANLSTANYSADNFGLKLWKKTATGTLHVNSARYDWAYDTMLGMPFDGETSNCSSNSVTTTVDRNGTALGFAQKGFLCMQEDQYGNARLYWIGTNGEARHISNLMRFEVTSPAADTVNSSSACITGASGSFDGTDPNKLYCVGAKSGGTLAAPVLYSCSYNPAHPVWGNYREWKSNFAFFSENPAVSCVNITKASQGMDLRSQILTLEPAFKGSYFGDISGGVVQGKYLQLIARQQQNSTGYLIRFDTTTNRVTQAVSSFGGPIRWGGIHGSGGNATPRFANLYIAPLVSPTAFGIGRYQVNLTGIRGLTDTNLAANFTDMQTCEQMGVSNPQFVAEGATGRQCILVAVTGEPYNPTPHAGDLAAFPHPMNAASCGGNGTTANCWSKLQDALEGDYMQDLNGNGYGEAFRLVKKVSATSWILQRGTAHADCTANRQEAHGSGWTLVMWPRGVCSATFYWIDTDGRITIDSAVMNQGHHDILTDTSTDAGVYVQAGYDIRRGAFPDQIGLPADFHSFGSYQPKFAGSTAALSTDAIQSHPSTRQHIAPPGEQRWLLDGRPYGGALGGANSLFYNTVHSTATDGVYLVDPPRDAPNGGGRLLSSLDRKRLPLQVWAGRYLLNDKSGPGSVLGSADRWMYCVADFAGECVAGSQAGQVFMNVPQASLDGLCLSNFEINAPCWTSASPVAPFITQVGLDKPDADGTYWRRLSNFLAGIGWTTNYWNARPLPDASWAFTDSPWLNGTHTELMLAKLPPWPEMSTSVQMDFAYQVVSLDAAPGRLRRIRFGYDANLACTSRQEQCSTAGPAPFTWLSEPQTWTDCSGSQPCEIRVPALRGKVLYWVVDTDDGAGNITTSGVNLTPVP